jgi:putative transposase
MPIGKRRTAAQIQLALRQAEHDLAKGLTIGNICRKLGVSQNTFYRWRQKYTTRDDDDSHRVHELSLEVDRLKMLVAELMLDKQMLQEVAKKKW